MGRKFPVEETINGVNQDYHFASVALFIACIAATFAIVSSLCGSLSRKKSEPPSTPLPSAIVKEIQENNNKEGTTQKDYSSSREILTEEEGTDNNNNNNNSNIPQTILQQDDDDDALSIASQQQQQPLPPPPGRRHLSSTISYHFRSDSTASTSSQTTTTTSKLPTSMSMRVFGNGLGSRQASKRDHHHHHLVVDLEKRKDKKLLKHEDSIWKKTIILGEKCRIPEEDDDTIFYDEKGNRISTYHPKSSSKPLSRQNSITDPADFIS